MIRARSLWLLIVLLLLAGCGRSATSELPVVQVVTVVVTTTPAPSPTPLVVTEVQTVVVTATAPRTPLAAGTPAATAESAPNVKATSTVPPRPTSTRALTSGFKYAAPRLVAPVGQAAFAGDPPTLQWEGVSLAEDEYYEVTIERLWQNQPYYSGSDWVREPQMTVPAFVRGTSDTDHYTWWVTIKRLTGTNAAGGKVGESISPPSEQRTFTWSRP